MADTAAATPRNVPGASVLEEARRRYLAAREFEHRHDRGHYLDALKSFLAFVEDHQSDLVGASGEIASRLDEVAVGLSGLSESELAQRAVELGLALAPGSSSLLHHKALILLGQNRDLEKVLPLLDTALTGSPHDKAIWATKGDTLKLRGRPDEAAEAYLRAQQLDVTSMQYVERALKLVPNHPVALRMKLQLAKVHGGDKQALEACDLLLASAPHDPGLLLARAELLSPLADSSDALKALDAAKSAGADPRRVSFLRARILVAIGRVDEAKAEFVQLLGEGEPLDGAMLTEVAGLMEQDGRDPALALTARERLSQLEPRNVANLQALRTLARDQHRIDLGIAACRGILESSPDNLEAMRTLAELLTADGKADEAFETYRRLLSAHPHEAVELRRALVAAQEAGRPELIEEFAKVLLAEVPDDVPAREELARTLAGRGDKEGALAAYEALSVARPDDVGYLLEERRLLTELGASERLPAVYDEIFRRDPTRSDVAVERGNLYLTMAFARGEGSDERGEAARAALVSYERSSLDPAFASQSLLGLARASRLVDDHEKAIHAYQQFLAQPDGAARSEVWKELGHALRDINRLTEADEAYEKAIAAGLEDADLLWGEVEVLSLLNQDSKALRFVELLLQREPQNPLFLRRKGQLMLKTGRRSEGLAVLKSAAQDAHGDPHLLFEVAEALRGQGAYPDAIDYFRQGLAIDPKSRPGRLALAETQFLAGQYNEAIPQVDQLLKEDPNDLAAWKTRADAYRAMGRPAEVQYSLKAILLLDPHHGPALMEKFRLHLSASEKSDALASLDQLLSAGGAESQDAALWLQHGDLAASLGRPEDANRSYERAAQLDPAQRSEIAARRARLRLSAGRPDLALEVLDEALGPNADPAVRGVSVLLLRAEILMALERAGEAVAVYEEVRTREPRSPVALAGLARCLLDQGKHAEAKEFLSGAIPQLPPQESLFLLLAEAESGLGQIPAAVSAVQKGVEVIPKSEALWVRLGELNIVRETWPEAANAFAHAIALEGTNPEWLMRAGFVAEKLGHPNEALSLYEHATSVAPANKDAWCRRGLALLATGRSEDARQSFERSLALDSDFEAAKEGKRLALQRTRESQVERLGREALLLEAKLNRTVTKNDLFVTLHVPFDLLESVLAALSRNPKIDLAHLPESDLQDLESASYHMITAALDRRPEGIERRGFSLADVAVLSPPALTLDQIQRLFGYLRAVLETDLRAENLRLTPDVEELARRALLLPPAQRTLFQLVRTLRVGLYKARLIKAVESAGGAVHAPLPSLDLGAYSPEFQSSQSEGPFVGSEEGEKFFAPENEPSAPHPSGAGHPTASTTWNLPTAASTTARCVGCGGIASVVHQCGASVCQHCIAEFHTCPKCQQPISMTSSRPVEAADSVASSASHAPTHQGDPARSGHHPLKNVLARPRILGGKGPTKATHPASEPAPAMSRPEPKPEGKSDLNHPRTAAHPPATGPPGGAASKASPEAEGEKPPRPAHPREKPDDEPRL